MKSFRELLEATDKYILKKQTLSDIQSQSNSSNNARYKGSSPVWVIYDSDDEYLIHYKSKKEAVIFLDWANKSWDGKGDPEQAFINDHK